MLSPVCGSLDVSKPLEYHAFDGPYKFSFGRTDEEWKTATLKQNKIRAQNPDPENLFGIK